MIIHLHHHNHHGSHTYSASLSEFPEDMVEKLVNKIFMSFYYLILVVVVCKEFVRLMHSSCAYSLYLLLFASYNLARSCTKRIPRNTDLFVLISSPHRQFRDGMNGAAFCTGLSAALALLALHSWRISLLFKPSRSSLYNKVCILLCCWSCCIFHTEMCCQVIKRMKMNPSSSYGACMQLLIGIGMKGGEQSFRRLFK